MIGFKDWYEHYSPLVEYLYYEFISISYNRGIEIVSCEEAYDDFAFTLYNTSKNITLTPEYLWPIDPYDD